MKIVKIGLALALTGVVGYVTLLLAPIILFWYVLVSLDISHDAWAAQLKTLATVSVVEASDSPAETANRAPVVTLTLSAADVRRMMIEAVIAHQLPLFKLRAASVQIAPEQISLALSWHIKFFDFTAYETTMFSEWTVLAAPAAQDANVIFTPLDLHTNHLYSVNWANLLPYAPNLQIQDGGLHLPLFDELGIHAIALQDREVTVSMQL